MKSSQAWFACSLVSVTCALASCGDEDGKRAVRGDGAGAGGESGGEPSNAGGSAITPAEGGAGGEPEPLPEGGTGGAPIAAAGGMSGEGGAGGQAPAPLCFDVAGGAGGSGAGGESAAPFRFACADLSGHYDPLAKKVVLDLLPGMEPATTGRFSARYYVDSVMYQQCAEGTLANTGTALELGVDFAPPAEDGTDIYIPFIALDDACGGELTMDNPSTLPDWCWGIRFTPPAQAGDEWSIDCYEGGGDACLETCPSIDL